jgi:uncharacterized membrane protein
MSLENSPHKNRSLWLDELRGLSLVLMTVYHFIYDLTVFKILDFKMDHDFFWIYFRYLIIFLFTSIAGFSLGLQSPEKLLDLKKPLMQIFLCALFITIFSYWNQSSTFIYFGILHFMFVAKIFSFPLIQRPRLSAILGFIILCLPLFFSHEFFFKPFWIITGLSPLKPKTDDFVPLLPWLGVMFISLSLGRHSRSLSWISDRSLFSVESNLTEGLRWIGRHSLLYYMTHQGLLFPLAWIISRAI